MTTDDEEFKRLFCRVFNQWLDELINDIREQRPSVGEIVNELENNLTQSQQELAVLEARKIIKA